MTEPPVSVPPSEPPASAGASATAASPSEATASGGASATTAPPSEATASADASTASASPSEATASADAYTTAASPPEATDSPIAEERVWQFLKEKWATLRARITMAVERVDQLSKKSWKWRYCVKFPLNIIMVIMEIIRFLIKNLVDCRRLIWGFIKDSGEGNPDKFWKENAYDIIRSFGTLGAVVLLGFAMVFLFIWKTSALVQSVYYFFIFVGVAIASAIATWRGRQSERQIHKFEQQLENSRFEKAVDMATDPTSEARREMGFLRLKDMLSAWRGNFDDATEENIGILTSLAHNYFGMTGEQLQSFSILRARSTLWYGKEEDKTVQVLFRQTPQLIIDTAALDLWKGVVNWNRRKFDNPPVNGIYAHKAISRAGSFLLFSKMNLEDIQFLVMLGNGEIDLPAKGMHPNFKFSCFIQADMHNAIINHVSFIRSYLLKINRNREGLIDYKMSCVGTIFNKAFLIECNFEGADLEGAYFVGTNISGSDFSRAKNLTPEQFRQGAYWIKPGSPQFPNNFPPDFADKLPNKPPTEGMVRMWEIEAGLDP